MVSIEENETLVRVGPGTPMGRVMRKYWHPIATSAQLPAVDSDPLRVTHLGEQFVLFRDSDNQLGLLDEFCLHRRISLAIGRVEEGGIRCLYHGWKFAVDGKVLETPNHPDPRYRERVHAKAYAVKEVGGLIWAYIGPQESQPPFRHFPSDDLSDEARVVLRVDVKANYLQLWEGGLDSSHVSVLHTNQARRSWAQGRGSDADVAPYRELEDTAPQFAIEDTAFGYHYAATRTLPARDGIEMNNIRIVPAILPTGRIIPGPNHYLVWETPVDDANTTTFVVAYNEKNQRLEESEVLNVLGLDDARIWNADTGEFKLNWENGFLQDREAMRSNNWTGLRGIEPEDATMSLSAGAIVDRSKENLVAADLAIVKIRRRLLDCVALEQQGKELPGSRIEDMRAVMALDIDIGKGGDWRKLAAVNAELGA